LNLNKVSDFLGQGGPVRRTFSCIDKLIGKALCNGLDVPESTFPSTGGKKVDCLVHTPQRRYINCLPSNNTSRSNTSCIFPWTTKLDKNITPLETTKAKNTDAKLHNSKQKYQQGIHSLPIGQIRSLGDKISATCVVGKMTGES